MREAFLKRAILSALRPQPDLAALEALRDCDQAGTKRLLLWLDQSGLALHFLDRLQRERALDLISAYLRLALERRAEQNRLRVDAMLREFRKVNESLASHGVRYCALKGFTLVPEYCGDPFLRHQTDFDFLVDPGSVKDAALALAACGYEPQESGANGETTYGTPLLHTPSRHDNIYDVPRHRQVDVHTVLWHEAHCVSIGAPIDCLNRVRQKRLLGQCFPTLAEDHVFLLQVFHAFQHLLGSWIRLSWLFELDHFLETREKDSALWRSVCSLASEDAKLRTALGLVLSLTTQVFPRRLSPILEERFLVPLPRRVETWVREFGVTWAISDLPGNKLTLFVHRHFVSQANLWRKYVRSRIFPMHLQSSLGLGAHPSTKARVKGKVGRWVYALGRVIFHVREIGYLAMGTIRWRRALRSVPP
jgi:hypothetical protein